MNLLLPHERRLGRAEPHLEVAPVFVKVGRTAPGERRSAGGLTLISNQC
jgi:hypothetical protein